MGFEKIVCCYHRYTAYCIQYFLLIIDILGIIISIIDLAVIKWEYIPGGIKFLYIICFIIYIFSTLCTAIIISFRRNKTINDRNNKPCIKISQVNIILSIIGLIFSFICFIIIWVKYEDNKDEKNISGWNKVISLFCLGVNSRFMLFLFFFWTSILIRLFKKTNGAFIEKKLDQTVTNTSSTSNISDNREVTVNYGIREVSLK